LNNRPADDANYDTKNKWVKDVSTAQSDLTNARASFERWWLNEDGTSKFYEAQEAAKRYNSLGKDGELMSGFELTTSDIP